MLLFDSQLADGFCATEVYQLGGAGASVTVTYFYTDAHWLTAQPMEGRATWRIKKAGSRIRLLPALP
jgi:hypothetical protein